MGDRTPLSTLLAQTLIAFTIEFDDDFERQMMASPYRPFLVSMVMWSNFMRFVPEEGISVGELSLVAGVAKPVHPSLPGMERWGYVKVEADASDTRHKPPRADFVVRPGPAGLKACEIWRPLDEEIEGRWRVRFGDVAVEALEGGLRALLGRMDADRPHYLPVLMSPGFAVADQEPVSGGTLDEALRLSGAMAQVLLAFTLDFERDSELSLPLNVNVLRVLDEHGVTVKDLPGTSGVSKEAITMSLGFLEKNGYVTIEPDPNRGTSKLARLTPKGQTGRDDDGVRLERCEAGWRARFGEAKMEALRDALDAIVGHERFADGLRPHDGGWRTRKPYLTRTEAMMKDPRAALPHHPMVLHRGGWPDGS